MTHWWKIEPTAKGELCKYTEVHKFLDNYIVLVICLVNFLFFDIVRVGSGDPETLLSFTVWN